MAGSVDGERRYRGASKAGRSGTASDDDDKKTNRVLGMLLGRISQGVGVPGTPK